MKTDKKKLVLVNSSIGIFYEIVSVVCGMILPRMILSGFGSSYNGITSSITQFLSFITIVRGGIGGVSKVHLYKSLENEDHKQTNVIMKSIGKFMNRVSLIYLFGLLVFSIFYPILVSKEFEWFFSFSLVLIIGASTFFENLVGFSSQIILQADQREYITTIANIITIILNTVVAAILIKHGCSIHVVKLGSALVFIAKPILLAIYVSKRYEIDGKNVKPDMSLLSQRKDAVIHTIAEFIHLNTDVMILTIFTTTKEISVYTVYHIIVNGLRKLVRSLTSNIEALLGNLHAKNQDEKLLDTFHVFSFFIFAISSLIFTCAAVLAEPFVMVYTHGVTDVNYSRTLFAIIIILGEMVYSIRLPYQFIIRVYGNFKETKWISITEALINISISLILVQYDPLVGIATGTLVAMLFRTIMYAEYVSANLLHDGYSCRIRGVLLCICTFIATYLLHKYLISKIPVNTYTEWIISAALTFVLSAIITYLLSITLFKKELDFLVKAYFKSNKKFKK